MILIWLNDISCYDMMLWVVYDKLSYDSWSYIVDVQIRFMVDSLMMHIWCLHGDLHKNKEKYKAWIHIFLTWWWVTYILLLSYAQRSYSYDAGTHVDKDCCCWWYQEVLSKELELKIHSADTWMTTQSCFIGDMVMSSYLYDDRFILTYVNWCRCSQVMILGSCRAWWNGYGGFTHDTMWMTLNSVQRDELMQTYLVIGWWPILYRTFTGCWYGNLCTRVV